MRTASAKSPDIFSEPTLSIRLDPLPSEDPSWGVMLYLTLGGTDAINSRSWCGVR